MKIQHSFLIVLLAFILIATPLMAGEPLVDPLNGMSDDSIFQMLGPFMKMYATNMNSGLFFATHNTGFFGVGIQTNLTVNPKEGYLMLQDADYNIDNTDMLVTPAVFANIDIQLIDLVPFVRGLAAPTEGQIIGYFGAGANYKLINFALFELNLIGAYHWVSGYHFFDLGTGSLSILPEVEIPIPGFPVFVYANASGIFTHLQTTLLNADGDKYSQILLGYSISAGFVVELFDIVGIGYEMTILPEQNHHIAAGVYF